jgi:KaiC/GvpD/RAD55 family RecA-like ATPase
VPGADGWLLRGKRYLVVAAAGMGKSLGWLIVAVETVRAGGTVAMVDVENGADEYARRLELIVGDDQDLGAPAPSACAITNTRR